MTSSSRRAFRWLEWCLATLLVGVVGAEFYIYSPPGQHIERGLSVSAQVVRSDSTSTTVDVSIVHASGDAELSLAAFPLARSELRERSIYVYDDPDYPVASVNQTTAEGVFYHLGGELRIRNYSGAVVAVSATELVALLEARDRATSRVIVMMTGVTPAAAFSRQGDLLTPWVQAGGLVVWGGASIGYFSGIAGHPLADAAKLSYGDLGPPIVLGKDLVTPPWVERRTANERSEFASALGIDYQLASGGIDRNVALARGGLILGWYLGALSTVTYVPRGQGGYLIFAGEILDEVSVARDLARILLSRAVNASGPVADQALRLSNIPSDSIIRWQLPFGIPSAGIMFAGFDPNPEAAFYYTRVILS